MRYFNVLTALVLVTFFADSPPGFAQNPDIEPRLIADNLVHPWALEFLPGGDYLVSERGGDLLRVSPDGSRDKIYGLPENIYTHGQGGLLDLALEPGFKPGGWLYFSYAGTGENGRANTEVARAKLDLRENILKDLEVIFRARPKVRGNNHFGSRLLFAGGYLYITLGERFGYREEAQDISNHLGTVVRIYPDGKIPGDNPFAHTKGAAQEIFTYGNRNIQGIARHPQSDEIWVAEHGPKGGDEINILEAGANYGWPEVSYGDRYSGINISDGHSMEDVTNPLLHWTPSIAPSGMAFYTGDKYPGWENDLFVGALVKRHLRRVDLQGTNVAGQEKLLENLRRRIRDVAQGPDGYLYILTDHPDGGLYKLMPVTK